MTPPTSLAGTADCPCGGGRYADCCAPYLRRESWPPTAEKLMRSRYTAFALGDAEHLLRTWHPAPVPTRSTLATRNGRAWRSPKPWTAPPTT